MRILGVCVLLTCAGALCTAAPVLGDVIHRKDGGKIEGKIIAQTETEVRIATKYGVQSVPREIIKKIETTPTPLETYRQMLAAIPQGNADDHYQLGRWCKEQKLAAKARLQFREALKHDPGHHGARVELGYVYHGGRWVHVNELKDLIEQKGYVPYNGRLISKEEYEVLKAEEESEESEGESEEEEEEETGVEEEEQEDPGVPWYEAYDLKTSHYVIHTNLGKKPARRYTKLMEELHDEYRRAFRGYKPKTKGKLSVWLFRSQQDFMQETGRRHDVGGYYDAQAKRVVSYRGMFGSGTTDTVLAREGCHQYLDSIMTNMGAAPAWIVEGFAVYFESAKVSDIGVVKMGRLPRERLIQLKADMAQGKFIPVSQLIRRNRNRFGTTEQAHAWSLIFFMMKKGSGRYSKALSQFFDMCVNYGVSTTGGGRAGRRRSRVNLAAEFEKLIGDIQAFEDAWRRCISGMKVPPAGEVKGDTFTSQAMGFEITKPSGWVFVSEGSQTGFQTGASKKSSKFEVAVFANSASQDAKAFASRMRGNLRRAYAKVDMEDTTVSGLPGAQLTYSDENRRSGRYGTPSGAVNKYRVVVIATSQRIYLITFQAFASTFDADLPEFQQALKSFKLTKK